MKNASEKYIQTVSFMKDLYEFLKVTFFESALSIEPVITIEFDGQDSALGWFRPKETWKDSDDDKGNTQINISAQFLKRPIQEIASTMLHEMCHLYAYQMRLKDTSRNHYYHNTVFKNIAESHGLIAERIPQYGWTNTFLKQEALEIILKHYPNSTQLIFHKTQFDLMLEYLSEKGRDMDKEQLEDLKRKAKDKLAKKSSTRKYVCPKCHNSARATKDINLMCGDCHIKMVKQTKEISI